MGISISNEEIEKFNMISPLLNSVLKEVKSFSSKKQDGVLSVSKVNMINRILEHAKNLLKEDSISEFLETLDTDSLPSNSDAVIVIVQYEAALERFSNQRSIHLEDGSSMWRIIKN